MTSPTECPVSLREFLRIAIGGKYEADRERIYRAFIREQYLRCIFPPARNWEPRALDQEVEKVVSNWMAKRRRDGVEQCEAEGFVETIRKWLPGYRAELRKVKALKAAQTRWKAKGKKTS